MVLIPVANFRKEMLCFQNELVKAESLSRPHVHYFRSAAAHLSCGLERCQEDLQTEATCITEYCTIIMTLERYLIQNASFLATVCKWIWPWMWLKERWQKQDECLMSLPLLLLTSDLLEGSCTSELLDTMRGLLMMLVFSPLDIA